ncbi:hypothetical protein AB6A40_010763 [Gnathostoma spinigerum]|uniref:Uncharacterized protein n=1 Tax=Gnathostoma spinigerum TaxID=75299 RepID=A0ABD6F0G3_9BILA
MNAVRGNKETKVRTIPFGAKMLSNMQSKSETWAKSKRILERLSIAKSVLGQTKKNMLFIDQNIRTRQHVRHGLSHVRHESYNQCFMNLRNIEPAQQINCTGTEDRQNGNCTVMEGRQNARLRIPQETYFTDMKKWTVLICEI